MPTSSFFHVFDFKLLRGDPATALKEKFSLVFSESAAKKYFGNENPIGKTVLLTEGKFNATVTGHNAGHAGELTNKGRHAGEYDNTH